MADLNGVLFNWLFSWSHRNMWLDLFIVLLARYIVYLLILSALFLVASQKTWRKRVLLFSEMAMATILSRGIITEAIYFFYAHPRPFDALSIIPVISESGNSFPSGHATFLFALATVVFYRNRYQGAWFYALSVTTVLARVIAGVHWPFDVVGGALIGILSAICIHALLRSATKEVFMEHHHG